MKPDQKDEKCGWNLSSGIIRSLQQLPVFLGSRSSWKNKFAGSHWRFIVFTSKYSARTSLMTLFEISILINNICTDRFRLFMRPFWTFSISELITAGFDLPARGWSLWPFFVLKASSICSYHVNWQEAPLADYWVEISWILQGFGPI